MAIVNISEILVKQKLTELLEKSDCCKCHTCYLDMLAIALNNCPPHYVNTLQGELFVKIDSTQRQMNVDLDVIITKAIETVKNNPNHKK